jgi:hypothetical protein
MRPAYRSQKSYCRWAAELRTFDPIAMPICREQNPGLKVTDADSAMDAVMAPLFTAMIILKFYLQTCRLWLFCTLKSSSRPFLPIFNSFSRW